MFGKLQKEIIERGAACKQPTQEELMALFAPVSESSKKLDALDKDRSFPVNYVKAMREVIAMINWVVMVGMGGECEVAGGRGGPGDAVAGLGDVLDEQDPPRRARPVVAVCVFDRSMQKAPQDWCASVIAMGKALAVLVQDHFPDGFTWNPAGVACSEYTAKPAEKPAEKPASAMAGLKAELAQLAQKRNADGSLQLRHVEKSEMSHKNPALRGNVKMEEKKETWAFRSGGMVERSR